MHSNTKVPIRYSVVFSRICFVIIFFSEKYSETKYVCSVLQSAYVQVRLYTDTDNTDNTDDC